MAAGAKGKFTKSLIDKICNLKATGEYTNEAICVACGISEETLYRWMKEKNEFYEAFKKAELKATKNIAQIAKSALIKKIQGYEYEEVHTDNVVDEDDPSEIKAVHIKTIKKHVPPSDTAIIFALKNTDPANFSDKVDVNHGGQDGNPIIHRIERVIVDKGTPNE